MALPTHLTLAFVTADRVIAHEAVDEVQLPGLEGSFGVLPGHAPMLAIIATGQMWYRKGSETIYAFVDRGFVEVLPDRVSVLARTAERADDIDYERAQAAKRLAEETLARPHISDIDAEVARIALLRAITRLQLTQQLRPRR
jgi:F-type H+-transporting ATPase subunit epsilon